ncbi:MAG: hypothetical protein HY835_06660 [Anaerolineae bacterium]|nr:hypothetical protein [Anaerolineae bacterium]
MVVFSGTSYLHNMTEYRNPLGDAKSIEAETGRQDNLPVSQAVWININRLAYQFIDTTGLPPVLEGPLFRGKAHAASWIYTKLGMDLESNTALYPNTLVKFSYLRRPPLQEDETWFGILAPLIVVPASILCIVRGFRRKEYFALILFIAAAAFTLTEQILRPSWHVYLGRNFALAMVALTPMAATLYRRNWINQTACAAVLVLAAMITINVTVQNKSKPLTGQYAIWNLDRAVMITLNSFSIREAVVLVEQDVPGNAVVGTPSDYLEYTLYGDHLSRRIVPVFDRNQLVDRAWLTSQKVEYVISPDQVMAQHPTLPGIEIARNGAHILVKLEP